MNVIVVGGGKVGYYLVKTLIEHGHNPIIIEDEKKICNKIANELDIPVICGDGTRLEVLESSNAGEADAIICVTGTDEANLISCQLAKKFFNINKTVAKVNNPKNADVLKKLGVDIVISSTDNIAMLLEREVDIKTIKQLLVLNRGDAIICEIQLPSNYVLDGTQLMSIKISSLFNIISITRGDALIIPRGQSELKSGDKLMVILEKNAVRELNNALKLDK